MRVHNRTGEADEMLLPGVSESDSGNGEHLSQLTGQPTKGASSTWACLTKALKSTEGEQDGTALGLAGLA